MKLIFTPTNLKIGDGFSPSVSDQKHILKVLRLRKGDTIDGSDGGRRLKCEITRANVKLELTVTAVEALEDRRKISLAIARIDTARFSSAVSAAAQMAVRDIYSFGCVHASRAPVAMDRLIRVARESAKQVGCPFLPALHNLPDISALADKIRGRPSFLLDPFAAKTLLESFPYEIDSSGLLLIVGPVGDFTDAEKQQLQAAGARPVQLCREILRSETAAVVALGVTATCIQTSRQEL